MMSKPQPAEQPLKDISTLDRNTWRMPPLALLEPVTWNPATRLGMIGLRSYLVVGAILLVVKAIEVSHGG